MAMALAVLIIATPSFAQRRGSRAGGGGASAGRAVPRGSMRPAPAPRSGGYAPNVRSYRGPNVRYYNNYYGYYGSPWAWYGSGLYGGFYSGWGSPYGWGAGYRYSPYWGSAYGYGYPGYAYPSYGYGYGSGAVRATGGVRIDLDVRDAEVLVDGYYAGIVDDFDGPMQVLRLSTGPHRVEIERDGFEPVSFEVRVEPGRTVTYRTQLRPLP